MFFTVEKNVLPASRRGEQLRIEPWGEDSLRVRATRYPTFTGNDWALGEKVPQAGKKAGVLSFFRDGKRYKGGRTVNAAAPVSSIPVFEKL